MTIEKIAKGLLIGAGVCLALVPVSLFVSGTLAGVFLALAVGLGILFATAKVFHEAF